MCVAAGDSDGVLKQANLKLPELTILPDDPWKDDVLERQDVAERLKSLIWDMRMPFVVSIDGGWGTGKTFFLRRWQSDLELNGCRAIYFNAWEDDFCDDPLLAILGQMDAHFRDGTLRAAASRVIKVGSKLVMKNITGVISKTAGLQIDVEDLETGARDLLRKYQDQVETKREVKEALAKLAESVVEATGRPLVFIIDELDRCRPTFAIELLERVKHIFDVPNMVFIFGINKAELCESLRSIYGGIDADVYLRRFFDMQFALPEADAEKFARILMERYELETAFHALEGGVEDTAYGNSILQEFGQLRMQVALLWDYLGMSLRDIDHCVRLLVLLSRNMAPGSRVHHTAACLFVTLKFKEPALYRRMVERSCSAAEVLNYIEREMREKVQRPYSSTLDPSFFLDPFEVWLCCVMDATAAEQLQKLSEGADVSNLDRLPDRTKGNGQQGASRLLDKFQRDRGLAFAPEYDAAALHELPPLIDLYHEMVR